MAIDMTTVKQIMHNNKEVAKIEDGLGNILWQKDSEKQITISYYMVYLVGNTPASKTVTTTGGVYALTSADLPTGTGYIDGWTLDGSTRLTAGTTISDNVTLYGIQKISWTKNYTKTGTGRTGNIYDRTGSASAKTTNTLWNLKTCATATYTVNYSRSFTGSSVYNSWGCVGVNSFNGQIGNIQTIRGGKFKIQWNPAVRTVTFSKNNSYTLDKNYGGAYPMILVRTYNTTTKLYTNANVAANTLTSTITADSSTNAQIILQYGGWDTSGGGKTAWASQYRLVTNSGTTAPTAYAPTSNKNSNITDTIYIWTQP